MAVYTQLTESDLRDHLALYDLGELREFHGIAEGVENSNFLVVTAQGKFILTLFEKRVKAEELPFFIGLMEHLAARGIACPKPLHGKDGQVIYTLKNKAATLVTFLNGMGVKDIAQHHIVPLGECVARMHKAAADYAPQRVNDLSIAGWKTLIDKIGARADEVKPGLSALFQEEFQWLSRHWPKHLPAGVVHADLFPDNVFYDGNALTGVIDFYFACTDFWMYDLAITLNAWCFDANHVHVPARADALFAAYEGVRKITEKEWHALPVLARGASLRFLLTRTHDWVFHDASATVTRKDPLEYLHKLEYWQRIFDFSI